MSYEIVHTSAPRGLLTPHGGFVTVVATQGIPRHLLSMLEAISGLAPTEGEPRAGQAGADGSTQPSAVDQPDSPDRLALHAYRLITLGGRARAVVSRIVPCGLDHSGRPNRLAHHIVLEAHERPAAGPAWLLHHYPGFLDRWDGEPSERPLGPALPASPSDIPPVPCRSWQEALGDAGWAGEALRKALAHPARPVHVLLPGLMDIRPLAEEMIALLPREARWRVTFASRLLQSRPDVLATIRFIDRTDPAVEALRRRPGVSIIDPEDAAPSSDWVDAAREGRLLNLEPPRSAAPDPTPASESAGAVPHDVPAAVPAAPVMADRRSLEGAGGDDETLSAGAIAARRPALTLAAVLLIVGLLAAVLAIAGVATALRAAHAPDSLPPAEADP